MILSVEQQVMSGLTNVGADINVMEECLGLKICLVYSIFAVMPSLSNALYLRKLLPLG